MAIKSAVMIVVNTRECRCDKNDNGKKKRMFVELTRKWFQGGGLMPVIKGAPCVPNEKSTECSLYVFVQGCTSCTFLLLVHFNTP